MINCPHLLNGIFGVACASNWSFWSRLHIIFFPVNNFKEYAAVNFFSPPENKIRVRKRKWEATVSNMPQKTHPKVLVEVGLVNFHTPLIWSNLV
jgi:hypothetical protein